MAWERLISQKLISDIRQNSFTIYSQPEGRSEEDARIMAATIPTEVIKVDDVVDLINLYFIS